MNKFQKDVLYGRIKPTSEEMFAEFYKENYERPAMWELAGIFAFFIFLLSVILLNQ